LKGDKDFDQCPALQNKVTLSAVEFQSAPVDGVQPMLAMQEKVRQSNAYQHCPKFWVSFEVEPVFVEFFLMQPDFCADRLRFYNPRFNVRDRFDVKTTKDGDDGWFFDRLLP